MKKNISRNPLWPDWYNGKKIDEVQFGRAFLEQWPLKCVNGTLYTLDGPVEDESEIKQRILENIEEYVTSGLSKKVTNILETIKLLAFSDPFPIEQDCIHLQNGVYHLPDGTFQESRLFCQNRLPVKYDPKAASPDRWLTFLHELLDNACHSVSAIRFSAELRQNDRRYNLEATNNIYLPGGRRVRGFVGIEPLVHPCP